jgi:hypothetical protein
MSGIPPASQIWPPSAPPAPLPFPASGQVGDLIVGYSPLGEPLLSPGTPGRPTLARQFPGDFNYNSYLYTWYQDDDNLQAFVASFNALAQQYLTFANSVQLPFYPGPLIAGGLLDWVALGLYGMVRPLLPSGSLKVTGALGTYVLGTLPLGELLRIGGIVYYAVSDDYFKRILTWHLYKGDAKYFNVLWLKRRVLRFLTGANGIGGDVVDQLPQVSVSFATGNTATISLLQGSRTFDRISGALGSFVLGTMALGLSHTSVTTYPPLPGSPIIFQDAVAAGILELPFSYSWSIQIVNPMGNT